MQCKLNIIPVQLTPWVVHRTQLRDMSYLSHGVCLGMGRQTGQIVCLEVTVWTPVVLVYLAQRLLLDHLQWGELLGGGLYSGVVVVVHLGLHWGLHSRLELGV